MIIQTPISDKIKYMYSETNNDSETVSESSNLENNEMEEDKILDMSYSNFGSSSVTHGWFSSILFFTEACGFIPWFAMMILDKKYQNFYSRQ